MLSTEQSVFREGDAGHGYVRFLGRRNTYNGLLHVVATALDIVA